MITLKVDISQFEKELSAMLSKAERFAEVIINDIKTNVKNTTEFKYSSSSGGLKNSIVSFGSNGRYTVVANKHYASYVEEGRPGFSAKNAKALRFRVNGTWIFRKSVGPAAPRPFFRRAIENTQSRLQELWNSFK